MSSSVLKHMTKLFIIIFLDLSIAMVGNHRSRINHILATVVTKNIELYRISILSSSCDENFLNSMFLQHFFAGPTSLSHVGTVLQVKGKKAGQWKPWWVAGQRNQWPEIEEIQTTLQTGLVFFRPLCQVPLLHALVYLHVSRNIDLLRLSARPVERGLHNSDTSRGEGFTFHMIIIIIHHSFECNIVLKKCEMSL